MNPLGWICSGVFTLTVVSIAVILLAPLVRKAIKSAKGPQS